MGSSCVRCSKLEKGCLASLLGKPSATWYFITVGALKEGVNLRQENELLSFLLKLS